MSIKYKIALLFSLIVTILFALVSLSVYLFSANERENAFKKRLKNRALSTASVYADITDKNFAVLKRMDAAAVASLYNKSISIAGYRDVHEYMYSDKLGDSLYITQDIIEKTKIDNEYYFEYNGKKAVALHYINDDNNFIVAVSALDSDGKEYILQLKKILYLALLFSVLLSFCAGILFAGSLIDPIKRITAEANVITTNNFSQRLKVNNAKDELTRLAQTINDLLDRLQDSFSIQRRFISNASHELSTPLTAVSSQLEVAIQKERTVEEYKQVLNSVYEDVKDLHLLTHSLLDIAKAGSHGSIDLNDIRVDELLFKVISDVQRQNAGYKAEMTFDVLPDDEKMFTVFGNGNLLYIALKNVVENGCKYSENNESILNVFTNQHDIILKVFNRGDVIAESDIQNIFQPFFRTDSAQQKKGFGLGLTLTKRILVLHKGTISVESNAERGTTFTITLPNTVARY